MVFVKDNNSFFLSETPVRMKGEGLGFFITRPEIFSTKYFTEFLESLMFFAQKAMWVSVNPMSSPAHSMSFPASPMSFPGLSMSFSELPMSFPALPMSFSGLPMSFPAPPMSFSGLPMSFPELPKRLPGLPKIRFTMLIPHFSHKKPIF